ncbi:MAG: OsmC family protein [Anaerolineae bacterium]
MIQISAQVNNRLNHHQVTVTTNQNPHTITIEPKASGYGSSANGGELLFLALATCFCNDLYREAAKKGIAVKGVEVTVSGEFGDAPGSAAQNITYAVRVEAEAPEADIAALIQHTDTVTEIQNTLRQGAAVTLGSVTVISNR